MTVRQLPGSTVPSDFIPQAILDMTPAQLHEKLGIQFATGNDDLDFYQGAMLTIDDGIIFAFKQYAGHPKNQTTIYLPPGVKNVENVTDIVSRIMLETHTPQSKLYWQRVDGPNL